MTFKPPLFHYQRSHHQTSQHQTHQKKQKRNVVSRLIVDIHLVLSICYMVKTIMGIDFFPHCHAPEVMLGVCEPEVEDARSRQQSGDRRDRLPTVTPAMR